MNEIGKTIGELQYPSEVELIQGRIRQTGFGENVSMVTGKEMGTTWYWRYAHKDGLMTVGNPGLDKRGATFVWLCYVQPGAEPLRGCWAEVELSRVLLPGPGSAGVVAPADAHKPILLLVRGPMLAVYVAGVREPLTTVLAPQEPAIAGLRRDFSGAEHVLGVGTALIALPPQLRNAGPRTGGQSGGRL